MSLIMLSISIEALIVNDRWMRKTLRDFAETSLRRWLQFRGRIDSFGL